MPVRRARARLDGPHPRPDRRRGVEAGGLEEGRAEEVVGPAEGVVGGGVEAEDGDAVGDAGQERPLERVGQGDRFQACGAEEGGLV